MQQFPVSHLELFKATARGIPIPMRAGVRYLSMNKSLAAVPVEVFIDTDAADGSFKDNQLTHKQGMVLYPGKCLCLKNPVQSYITVRNVPGASAGFQYVNGGSVPLPEVPRSSDWRYTFPASDAIVMSAAASGITIFADDYVMDDDGEGLPSSLRIAALSQATLLASVSNTLILPPPTAPTDSVLVLPPHATVPLEIVRRYSRARLKLGFGPTFKATSTIAQACARMRMVQGLGNPSVLSQMGGWVPLRYGSYNTFTSGLVRFDQDFQQLIFDFGAPADLFSALSSFDTDMLGLASIDYVGIQTAPQYPSVIGEWLLDHGQSKQGVQWSSSVNNFGVTAGNSRSMHVFSPAGRGVLTAYVSVTGAGAKIYIFRISGDTNPADATDNTDQAFVGEYDISAVGSYQLAIGSGNYMVAVYNGRASGSVTAIVNFQEAAS